MRDEKEERKKQARSNKQTRQSNTAHPSVHTAPYWLVDRAKLLIEMYNYIIHTAPYINGYSPVYI